MDEYQPSRPINPLPMYRPRRRVALPVVLFLLTCASTFWAGTAIEPWQYLETSLESSSLMPIRRVILANYADGLAYMATVLGILFAHEMGHFLATVFYRIPASLPFFLPLPITPIGTLGAVIGIDGRRANRKEIFDIGIAGPLAGLVIALPVMWYAASHLDLRESNGTGGLRMEMPLGIHLIMQAVGPERVQANDGIWLGHLQGNPLFLAGWVGFLITGLNMVPVSQLDGGHVLFCLFRRKAYWIARGLLLAVGVHIAWAYFAQGTVSPWILMALLVLVMGPDHPPTRDDTVPLGMFRTVLGLVSLTIPILCLPVQPFST